MLLHPEVHHRKYQREIERLDAHAEQLQRWGCFRVPAPKPYIDVLFVPEHTAVFPVHQPSRSGLVVPGGAPVVSTTFRGLPVVQRTFCVRFGLEDFDARAPSVTFVDPRSRELLGEQLLPYGGIVQPDGTLKQVLLPQHPVLKRPFLCIRGVREYHEHEQHVDQHGGDQWELYRAGSSVFDLVQEIWSCCIVSVRPVLVLQGNGVLAWTPAKAA